MLLTSLLLVSTLTLQVSPVPVDFSGTWTLVKDRSSQTTTSPVTVAVAGLLGERFTARQTAKSLALDITVPGGRVVTAVYNLDGSESRNLNPTGPGLADEPIYSRVNWEGSRLVIETRGSILIDGKPIESRRVMWIDSDGLLTIERSSVGSPTTRSVYRQVLEP